MSKDEVKSLKTLSKAVKNARKAVEKLENLGRNKIVQEINHLKEKEVWIISPEGHKLRKICGHSGATGICLLPAGWGTEHNNFGLCKKHSRSVLYNPLLSADHNYPARFVELMRHADNLQENDLMNVDHEIKMLYSLQQYLLTLDPDHIQINTIEMIKDITMDIVKTKSIKNKIQREIRLDATAVKEFVNQIFGIITHHIQGPLANNILTDIYNNVLVPFRNKDRIVGGDVDISNKTEKMLKKVNNE